MGQFSTPTAGDAISARLYTVEGNDPLSQLVDRSEVSADDVAQIGRLMTALSALRDAERHLSEASQRYMRLSRQDMRALHYLIVARHGENVVTPGMLTAHLGISAASTTKLLNRLEREGHVTRNLHPTDRRAFAIEVTPSTETAAMASMGRQQAKRFHAAARLTPAERDVVIGFLEDMTSELSLDDADWAEGSTRVTDHG